MDTSPVIGTSIFLYIIGAVVVLIISAYVVYHTSPRRKQRREAKRHDRN